MVQWRDSVPGFSGRLFQRADLQPLRAARLPLGGAATTYFWTSEEVVEWRWWGCRWAWSLVMESSNLQELLFLVFWEVPFSGMFMGKPI